MPAYRTHVAVNLSLGLPIALAAIRHLATPNEILSFSAAYIYGTLLLHPDLDLAHKIRLFSWKGLLTLPFRLYSRLFRHRGLSHMPVIGTLTRVAWLMGLFYLLDWAYPSLNNTHTWFAIGGLTVADFFHVLLDRLR